ncbi:hypothetical protein [Komagataeibacter sp. FNDCF1]|uniref:hypothetical protein n=1 Tax=Komagataeibacter sp. FNDCF1 TaxID=2878681 RepID=UPI001E59CBD2|nr:hypothetical protein [Komagataeibacter sp. FNDCF1]MCE2565569.1 hypothetical protein [Komagataeibacter sp. FNDCF1]
MSHDQRIMLEFVTLPHVAPPRGDTLLVVGAGVDVPAAGWAGVIVVPPSTAFAAMGHGTGCACCTGRGGGVAAVLADAFRRRATGALPWFGRVAVVSPPGQEDAWRASLGADVLVTARFAVRP